ncbi:MAG: aminotransferase class IV [Gemmataceae bacterium]|nr:aminotransferase class IV [Gemmataceae bacterium]
MSLVWANGTLVDKADARVSPFDHGFLYGDGVWDHLRVFGGKLFRPAEVTGQLFAAARQIGLDIPHAPDELLSAVDATVRANNRTDGYVRVIVSRGPGTIGPDPRKIDPQVIIVAEEYQPFPLELYGHGLHVVTAQMRVDVANPAARVRTLGRPHVVLAKQHALRHGCLDAVLVTTDDVLAGTTEGSLFAVHAGALTTHPDYLPDATAAAACELIRSAGLPLKVTGTRLDGLRAADETFLAGTACGVIGVVRLDGTDIGTGTEGPVTKAIREAYNRLTRTPE